MKSDQGIIDFWGEKACFSKAFRRVPQSLTGSVTSPVDNPAMVASITSDITGNPLSSAEYEFIVSLEIRERVAKVRIIIFLPHKQFLICFCRIPFRRFHATVLAFGYA